MDDELLLPVMYLDEELLKGMHSLILSGSIQTRSIKLIQDRTLTGRSSVDVKENEFNEDRCSEDKKDGYKTNNTQISDHRDYTITNDASIENKNNMLVENQITKTYLTFSLHNELFNKLDEENLIKYIDINNLNKDTIEEGQLIRIRGKLTPYSIMAYLDSIIAICDSFTCELLNKLVKFDEKPPINFTIIKSMLEKIRDILNPNFPENKIQNITQLNKSQDLILNCGNTPVILIVNTEKFRNNSIYDKIDSSCTVFGKVIRVVQKDESISMIRKTAQYEYYEEVLNLFEPYFLQLRSSGIPIPDMPKLNYDGFLLVVVPVSILM